MIFLCFFAHNNHMIYLIGLIAGFLNGFFTSGAGQVIVVYLIYIMCLDTVKSRATSVVCMTIGVALCIFRYMKMVQVDIAKIILVVCVSLVCGFFGPKILKKMDSNILNLFSGTLIVVLGVIKLFIK